MNIFLSSWDSITRILIVSLFAYGALVSFLRLSGNRTLSKMNSFDLVITVALGSTLSSGIIQKNVPLTETLLAFATLIALQFVVTWLSVRSKKINRLVKSEPTLLFHNGTFLDQAMKKSRVNEDEIRSAARQQGHGSMDRVQGVVLETNGQFSVY